MTKLIVLCMLVVVSMIDQQPKKEKRVYFTHEDQLIRHQQDNFGRKERGYYRMDGMNVSVEFEDGSDHMMGKK